jgi:hypothetical protein
MTALAGTIISPPPVSVDAIGFHSQLNLQQSACVNASAAWPQSLQQLERSLSVFFGGVEQDRIENVLPICRRQHVDVSPFQFSIATQSRRPLLNALVLHVVLPVIGLLVVLDLP